MFRVGLLFTMLLPLTCAGQTAAPSPSVQRPQSGANPGGFVEQIRLGDSVVPLVGPWKFSPGDNPAWSQPGFDDSSWSEIGRAHV